MGRIRQVNAVGSAGENNSYGCEGFDFLQRHGVGLDLAINVAFPDAPGNELVILSAKV